MAATRWERSLLTATHLDAQSQDLLKERANSSDGPGMSSTWFPSSVPYPRGSNLRPVRGLLRRMAIKGGPQHCIGKEVSRFEQGKDDFIENIDDVCIHYDRGRVAANESLVAEISARGLRKTTKETGIDRKTIRAILNGKKVKALTLAKVVMGLREEWSSAIFES